MNRGRYPDVRRGRGDTQSETGFKRERYVGFIERLVGSLMTDVDAKIMRLNGQRLENARHPRSLTLCAVITALMLCPGCFTCAAWDATIEHPGLGAHSVGCIAPLVALPIALVLDVVAFPFQVCVGCYPYGDLCKPGDPSKY